MFHHNLHILNHPRKKTYNLNFKGEKQDLLLASTTLSIFDDCTKYQVIWYSKVSHINTWAVFIIGILREIQRSAPIVS